MSDLYTKYIISYSNFYAGQFIPHLPSVISYQLHDRIEQMPSSKFMFDLSNFSMKDFISSPLKIYREFLYRAASFIQFFFTYVFDASTST